MTAAATPLPASSRRVLVIDDEPAVLKALGMVLQRRGFSVDTMSSAKAALVQIPQQKRVRRARPDVRSSKVLRPDGGIG